MPKLNSAAIIIQNQYFINNSIRNSIKFTRKINECHKIATKSLPNKILLHVLKLCILNK